MNKVAESIGEEGLFYFSARFRLKFHLCDLKRRDGEGPLALRHAHIPGANLGRTGAGCPLFAFIQRMRPVPRFKGR